MDRKIKVNAILVLLILFITTIGFQVKAEAMGRKFVMVYLALYCE